MVAEPHTFILGETIHADDVIEDIYGHKFNFALIQIGTGKPVSQFMTTYYESWVDEFRTLVTEIEEMLTMEYEIDPDSPEDDWLRRAREALAQWIDVAQWINDRPSE